MKVNWIDLLVWILPNGLEVCIFLILRLLLKRIYPRQRFGTSAPESIFNKYRGHNKQVTPRWIPSKSYFFIFLKNKRT